MVGTTIACYMHAAILMCDVISRIHRQQKEAMKDKRIHYGEYLKDVL